MTSEEQNPVDETTETDDGEISSLADAKAVRAFVWGSSAILSAAFVAFVYFYSTYAGPWVDRLDERVGEIVAERARLLADAGLVEEALAEYRNAISVEFDEPFHRMAAANRFTGLLLGRGEHEEAAAVAEDNLERTGGEGGAFSFLYRARRGLKQYEEALAVTRAWFAWAVSEEQPRHQAWARYAEGETLLALGDQAGAVAAYREVYALHSTPENALSAAGRLAQTGEVAEALRLLAVVKESGKWRLRRDADALEKRLQARGK